MPVFESLALATCRSVAGVFLSGSPWSGSLYLWHWVHIHVLLSLQARGYHHAGIVRRGPEALDGSHGWPGTRKYNSGK